MKHWFRFLGVLVLLLAFTPSPVLAQRAPSETFEPKPIHTTSIWGTARSTVPEHLTPSAGLILHFADDPVVLVRPDGTTVARLVDHQLKAELGVGVGLFDRLELGFVLPVILSQDGETFDGLSTADSPALNDIRAALRLHIFAINGVGVAVEVTGSFPSGSGEPYQSSGSVGVLPALIVDYESSTAVPFVVAGNLGWRVRAEETNELLATDDTLDWRLGAEIGLSPQRLHLLVSSHGRWEAVADSEEPVSGELLAGGRYFFGESGWSSTIGVGSGIAGGYGSPDFRAILSIAFTPEALGVAPRSYGHEAGQDCLPGEQNCTTASSKRPTQDCPNPVEDVDGFEDDDECADPDNDEDGVVDFEDACPNTPGEPLRAGCPFVDDDNDGIDASEDQCPSVAEDVDQFEDADGCPDPDNDRDGILDADDACPNEPESINGIDDSDGCPDTGDSAVRMVGNRIEILERVYFDSNRAVIKARSHSVLKQVASLLKATPDIKVLRVEGHTDSRGADDNNLALSQQRAAAVKEFLIEQGIAASRLSARGYGESHPIADNETRSGRAENRRVEFHIIERETSK